VAGTGSTNCKIIGQMQMLVTGNGRRLICGNMELSKLIYSVTLVGFCAGTKICVNG